MVRGEAVNLFSGRAVQAVIATKNGRFRRSEKDVPHFFTASERTMRLSFVWRGLRCGHGRAGELAAPCVRSVCGANNDYRTIDSVTTPR